MPRNTQKEEMLSKAIQAIPAEAIMVDLENDLFDELGEDAFELLSKLNANGLHVAIANYFEKALNS